MLKQISFLILPVIGGYAFSIIWVGSSYHAARESGHRLYFRAFFYGIFLWIAASLIQIIIIAHDNPISGFFRHHLLDSMRTLNSLWLHDNQVDPLDFSLRSTKYTAALIALMLGLALGHVLNLPSKLHAAYDFMRTYIPDWLAVILIPFYGAAQWSLALDRRSVYNAVRKNDFEKIVYTSFVDMLPILFTLKNNKVYVGYVVDGLNPEVQRKNVRLLPFLSGYRDDRTHEIRFTTSYVYLINNYLREGNDLYYLEMVLVADEVVSMHIFDVEAYETNFGGKIPRQEIELPR